MSPHIIRPVMFTDPPLIEHLDAYTIRGVADRLRTASTFEDFVHRESEMDALFTLADIALNDRNGAAQLDGAHRSHLIELRDLIFAAHDFTHGNDVLRAAELLERAARIVVRNN